MSSAGAIAQTVVDTVIVLVGAEHRMILPGLRDRPGEGALILEEEEDGREVRARRLEHRALLHRSQDQIFDH